MDEEYDIIVLGIKNMFDKYINVQELV